MPADALLILAGAALVGIPVATVSGYRWLRRRARKPDAVDPREAARLAGLRERIRRTGDPEAARVYLLKGLSLMGGPEAERAVELVSTARILVELVGKPARG